MTRLWAAFIAFGVAAALQPFAGADPVTHVALQMPMLVLAGTLAPVSWSLPREWVGPTFILALTTIAIWMLPRSVDAALTGWGAHFLKFATLPLCAGLPVALTWARIGPIARGVVKAQAVSMLLLLWFLYTHAPVRICNSYLVDDQRRLGVAFLAAAVGLSLFWLVPVFAGPRDNARKGSFNELPRLG